MYGTLNNSSITEHCPFIRVAYVEVRRQEGVVILLYGDALRSPCLSCNIVTIAQHIATIKEGDDK